MWIEIFKTGTHTDSSGKTRDWAEADLDKIASSYNPADYEAPIVIGHPKDNAPAYGWVESLKREGSILFAKLRNFMPEFVEMLKKGLFKKRSASFYPDLSLRHVGFLGATPPAVKGLADINFKEGDSAMTYEFTDADPGEQLHQKTLEIMKNPPKFDEYGREHRGYTYSEALSIAQMENPELTKKYCEILFEKKGTSLVIASKSETDADPGEELHRRTLAMMKDPPGYDKYGRKIESLSYSQAFSLVQQENPELTEKYIELLHSI